MGEADRKAVTLADAWAYVAAKHAAVESLVQAGNNSPPCARELEVYAVLFTILDICMESVLIKREMRRAVIKRRTQRE